MKKNILFFYAISIWSLPQDEYFSEQWYLRNTGYTIRRDFSEISSMSISGVPGADLGFPLDWNLQGKVGQPVVVAILDTGVDIGHVELKDAIYKSSECDSLGNLPPKNSPDRDGNGFPGDCAGWNFASSQNAMGDNQIYDDTGHGTHLAGLIAAKADSYGIRGISDQIKILPVKIFSKYESPNHPLRPKLSMMERIQKGLEYAISRKVDVINLSLGWPSALDNPKIRELFEEAKRKNILIVAAAGNNAQNTTIFPCSYQGVICVGATSVDGKPAPFSNYGGNVDLMAPGEKILSTIPKKITPLYFDEDGFDFKNGTSQAAPLVAGAAAFLKMVLGITDLDELKSRLLSSGTHSDGTSLYGNLNLQKALSSKPEQFLYLNLKDLNTVDVTYPDGRFEFHFSIDKMVPGEIENVEIHLNADPGIQLDQTQQLFSMKSDEKTHSIQISGRLLDLQLDSHQEVHFELVYLQKINGFQKELVFALRPEQVSRKVSFEEKIKTEKLRTVDDPHHCNAQPIFFTLDSSSQSLNFIFYAEEEEKMKRLFEVSKPGEWKPLAITFTGKNQVGLELYDVENKKIIFEFWNIETGGMEGINEMVPDYAFYHLSQVTFFKKLGGVVLAHGLNPPEDEHQSVFLAKNKNESDHLYFFAALNGKIKTRILDDDLFRRSIFKKYKLRYDDAIFPIALLSEGFVDSLDSLFVIGKGYQRKLIWVRHLDRDHFEVIREYDIPGAGAIRKFSFLGQPALILQESKDSYLVFDLNRGEFTRFHWSDRFDDLLSPIGLLDGHQLLVQTQNHFVVLGGEGSNQVPVKRFSFLPGEFYSELFTPVRLKSNDQFLPGLFIDGSMISDRHSGVVVWDGRKLRRPVYFQHQISENCRVLNPRRENGVDQFILVCQEPGKYPYLLKRSLKFDVVE
jgi:cell wall-associated protease